jgi:hypothetical protein
MKKLIVSASFVCLTLGFAGSASANSTVLNCTSAGGTMTLTIQGDAAGDSVHADIDESNTGLSYSEDGVFKDFENHGTDAVYTVSGGESETSVSEDLLNGKTHKGQVTRHIFAFTGGPGEAGWPDQKISYSCSR